MYLLGCTKMFSDIHLRVFQYINVTCCTGVISGDPIYSIGYVVQDYKCTQLE